MIKLVGALLVGAACVALGRIFSRQLRQHCELLAGIQQGLLLLEKEISYAATPLPVALARASTGAGPASGLFEQTSKTLSASLGLTAAEAWEAALENLQAQLQREEYNILTAFAAGLGLSDSAHQIKRIELTRLKLAEAERLAREQYGRESKVRHSLGWAAGAALILLFL